MARRPKEIIDGRRQCAACGAFKPLTEFYKNANRGHGVGGYCKPCDAQKRARYYRTKPRHREKYKSYNAQARNDVLLAYGGKCACCGEMTPEFLAIDHIFNDGAKERRESKRSSGSAFYMWLRKNGFPKDRYQLLCHNCNMAKGFYGQCPHERERAKEVAA